MKSRSLVLPAALGVTAFAMGYAGKLHSLAAVERATVKMPERGDATRKISDRTPPREVPHPVQGGKIILTTERSTNTVETLLALKTPGYGRIAAWLVEAPEKDLAAYWQGFKEPPPPDPRVTGWIFIVWSRLDPQRALAAVRGSEYETFAWQGWAEHDPQAALKAALATDAEEPVAAVATGIGRYHPEWLRAHDAEIPEAALAEATTALGCAGNNSDPLATLEFFKKLGRSFDPKTMQALVSKDPLAAYHWFKDNGISGWPEGDKRVDAMAQAFGSMASSQPEELQRLAGQTPAGADRRKMETALFKELAESDPAAALAQAQATKGPRIAAERLAVVGNQLAKSDPDAALIIVGQLFSALPDAFDSKTEVWYPDGGGMDHQNPVPGVQELVQQLGETHPAELLEMPWIREDSNFRAREAVESRWASTDLQNYTDWANGRSNPIDRERAIAVVVENYTSDLRFSDVADWLGTADPGNQERILKVLLKWDESQPGGSVARWLDSSKIPEGQKQELQARMAAEIQKKNAPEEP
jgi:hypothetical protein